MFRTALFFLQGASMKKNRPQRRKQNLVEQEVDGELLVYDLERNEAFCLNQTSMLVWQACDGKRTIADINDRLGKQLNSPVNDDVVWLAIDQLNTQRLLVVAPEPDGRFAGMSRREVIKKVGLGTMVALPVVLGVVAPPAILAQTACATTCTCDNAVTYAAGAVCMTTGGGAGAPCPAAPANCQTCHSIAGGMNSPGQCFTS